MSAAASRLALEPSASEIVDAQKDVALEEERLAVGKLSGITPLAPVIAVDLDDVLCQTNRVIVDWHNEKFGTKMDLSMCYYYYYWKNPFWGTPQETHDKVKEFYETDLIYNTEVVPGTKDGLQALKDMGYRLIIVTARQEDNADESWVWVEKNFPGIFESIICTGQFKDAHKKGHEVVTKLSKAQVCDDLGAKLLIDDSAENALQCSTAEKPTPVLLFGDYQWNRRLSGPWDARDEMSFNLRLAAEGGHEFWKDETVPVPEGAPLWRVNDWTEVVEWVKAAKVEGRI